MPDGSRFCANCGTALALTCAHCGASLIAGKSFCPNCGTRVDAEITTPITASDPLPAERRLCSILFIDLVGFTQMAENADPEDIRDLLGRYFRAAEGIISNYGGTVEKFIGDAVVAVWGAPVANEDDAERAVRAGLDVVASVTALGRDLRLTELRARGGVVTGEVAVTVGMVSEGMLAGDTVNSA
jgi:class 3 adenylate cyclase